MSAKDLLLTKYNAVPPSDPPALKQRKIKLNGRVYLDRDNTSRLLGLHDKYVDDLIIDFFIIMLKHNKINTRITRILSASTYYPDLPNGRTEDTLEQYFIDDIKANKQYTLIPVNFRGNHWILLRINHARNAPSIVEVFDSLNSNKEDFYSDSDLTEFLVTSFFRNGRFDYKFHDVIQQQNGIDCGLYTMFFIECLMNNLEIPKKSSGLHLQTKRARKNILIRLYKFAKFINDEQGEQQQQQNEVIINIIKPTYLSKAIKSYKSCIKKKKQKKIIRL